jgi:hypothetical protein
LHAVICLTEFAYLLSFLCAAISLKKHQDLMMMLRAAIAFITFGTVFSAECLMSGDHSAARCDQSVGNLQCSVARHPPRLIYLVNHSCSLVLNKATFCSHGPFSKDGVDFHCKSCACRGGYSTAVCILPLDHERLNPVNGSVVADFNGSDADHACKGVVRKFTAPVTSRGFRPNCPSTNAPEGATSTSGTTNKPLSTASVVREFSTPVTGKDFEPDSLPTSAPRSSGGATDVNSNFVAFLTNPWAYIGLFLIAAGLLICCCRTPKGWKMFKNKVRQFVCPDKKSVAAEGDESSCKFLPSASRHWSPAQLSVIMVERNHLLSADCNNGSESGQSNCQTGGAECGTAGTDVTIQNELHVSAEVHTHSNYDASSSVPLPVDNGGSDRRGSNDHLCVAAKRGTATTKVGPEECEMKESNYLDSLIDVLECSRDISQRGNTKYGTASVDVMSENRQMQPDELLVSTEVHKHSNYKSRHLCRWPIDNGGSDGHGSNNRLCVVEAVQEGHSPKLSVTSPVYDDGVVDELGVELMTSDEQHATADVNAFPNYGTAPKPPLSVDDDDSGSGSHIGENRKDAFRDSVHRSGDDIRKHGADVLHPPHKLEHTGNTSVLLYHSVNPVATSSTPSSYRESNDENASGAEAGERKTVSLSASSKHVSRLPSSQFDPSAVSGTSTCD